MAGRAGQRAFFQGQQGPKGLWDGSPKGRPRKNKGGSRNTTLPNSPRRFHFPDCEIRSDYEIVENRQIRDVIIDPARLEHRSPCTRGIVIGGRKVLGIEAVSESANRVEELGMVRTSFELLAQS